LFIPQISMSTPLTPLQRRIIAVDGLASTGKTSLSLEVARRLGFLHFSTGILYRAVGLAARRTGFLDSPAEENAGDIAELVRSGRVSLGLAENGISAEVLLDGQSLGEEIFSAASGVDASTVAKMQVVRDALFHMQREAFPGKHMVVEGRDIGTVIFPDAPVKFYITVDDEVAARRRQKQLQQSGNVAPDEKKLQAQLAARNANDKTRQAAPTFAAADAIVLDNSEDGMENLVVKILEILRKKLDA
jgi:cytidylate kinase